MTKNDKSQMEEDDDDLHSISSEEEEDLILNHKRNRTNYNSMYPYVDYDSSDYLSETYSYLDELDSDSDSESSEQDGELLKGIFSTDKKRKEVQILSHGWVPNFGDNTPPCAWVKVLYDNGDQCRILVPIFIFQSVRLANMMDTYANKEAIHDVAFQTQVQWLCSLRKKPTPRKKSNGTKRLRSKSSNTTKRTTARKSIPQHTNKSVAIPGSNVELLDNVREIKRSTKVQKEVSVFFLFFKSKLFYTVFGASSHAISLLTYIDFVHTVFSGRNPRSSASGGNHQSRATRIESFSRALRWL